MWECFCIPLTANSVDVRVYPVYSQQCGHGDVSFPITAVWTWGCIPVFSQQCGHGDVFVILGGIWNLESGLFSYLWNSVCKYIRNSAVFHGIPGIFYCKNTAQYCGIPYFFQKIPYSAGSKKSTSVSLVLVPDPLVRGMDPGPAPDSSIGKQKW